MSERRRHDLYEEVKTLFSEGSADELMSLLPPVGWTDVATKTDIAMVRMELDAFRAEIRSEMTELRSELRGEISGINGEMSGLKGELSGLRGEISGLRGEMSALRGDLRAELARTQAVNLRWMVGTIIGGMSVMLAVIAFVMP